LYERDPLRHLSTAHTQIVSDRRRSIETQSDQSTDRIYTSLLTSLAKHEPTLGSPHFTTRSSPVHANEWVAQLTLGSKVFVSQGSFSTKEDACEDAAKMGYEEICRMKSVKITSRATKSTT
jgi:hypothetical protein